MSMYFMPRPLVGESYSRELDDRVEMSELPYGYEGEPPAADTGDFDQERLESKKIERVK
jgi:hypothetical protein